MPAHTLITLDVGFLSLQVGRSISLRAGDIRVPDFKLYHL